MVKANFLNDVRLELDRETQSIGYIYTGRDLLGGIGSCN